VERDLRARWQIDVCPFGAFPDIALEQNKTSYKDRPKATPLLTVTRKKLENAANKSCSHRPVAG
jgi:hypothetical protein